MPKTVLIKNATVVFPNETTQADVLVAGGKIEDTDAPKNATADEVIDAAGLHLLPGAIDDQVHFRDPGLTHKEDLRTGSEACAAGGVTTFLEMPNTKPAAITRELIADKYALAADKSVVNHGFYIGATHDNVDELSSIENVPGIKIFIGSSTGDLLVDEQSALERIFAETTLPICAHCEDESTVRANADRLAPLNQHTQHSQIRDHQAAIIATQRAIDLATRHQHRFHVLHVSTAAEIEPIVAAAPYVTAEVCPHHLFFSVDDYERLGSLVQMNPSVKNRDDNSALWSAILKNQIQVIATDHAPHTLEEKQQDYPASPSGLPAVENYVALLLNEVNAGRCSIEQVAAWTSDAPARVWGLVGKGRIEKDYDADLMLVDLEMSRTITNQSQFTKSKWSPWAGVELQGWPVQTIVNGRIVFSNAAIQDRQAAIRVRCDHQRGGYFATPDGVGI